MGNRLLYFVSDFFDSEIQHSLGLSCFGLLLQLPLIFSCLLVVLLSPGFFLVGVVAFEVAYLGLLLGGHHFGFVPQIDPLHSSGPRRLLFLLQLVLESELGLVLFGLQLLFEFLVLLTLLQLGLLLLKGGLLALSLLFEGLLLLG